VNGGEDIESLRTHKEALARNAIDVADRRAEHFHLRQVVAIGPGGIFRNLDGVAERYHRRLGRLVRQKYGGEVLVLRPSPLKRSAQSIAAADFLRGQPLDSVT